MNQFTLKDLNARLCFCCRNIEELAAAVAERGINCSAEMIRQSFYKDNRPVFAVIRRECLFLSSRWENERKAELIHEIGVALEEDGKDARELNIIVPREGEVVVLSGDRFVGMWCADEARMEC